VEAVFDLLATILFECGLIGSDRVGSLVVAALVKFGRRSLGTSFGPLPCPRKHERLIPARQVTEQPDGFGVVRFALSTDFRFQWCFSVGFAFALACSFVCDPIFIFAVVGSWS
jgi:hypothetical protein